MDRQTFIEIAVGYITTEYEIPDALLSSAVASAENETGVAVSVLGAIGGGGDPRIAWLSNRVKFHLFEGLQEMAARKFDADDAKLSQRFQHFSDVLKRLQETWVRDIRPEVLRSRQNGFAMFETIPPGFSYDRFGRPVR